ncbi:hypothetical protein L9F63_022932 [Diploptera punctata]|uniref:Uncharacterized protein n=1 Tax=Diploptera punctata TaxID=6984 RepID=A0AAD7ZMC3_DIPPU|nr:hypothetical protein L9F63_022932 [Diploptera punctata]
MAVIREPKFNGTVPTLSLNSPTRSCAIEDLDPLHDELHNIQSMIRLTRENIDALNAKFAGFQHPPSMYLTEYQELTSKLHEFEVKEQELMELISNGRESPQDQCEKLSHDHSSVGDSSPKLVPRSPLKSVVRAHLPNQQRTSVQVRPGQSVREALSKAMKMRKLTPEMCVVYKGQSKVTIPWEADISTLEGEEISVEILDKFSITTSISHNFVRKTFFSLAFCECCRRLLFQGFYCRTCGYRFHQRCATGVPALCQQIQNNTTYYQILLAQNPVTSAGILQTPSPSQPQSIPRRHPPTMGARERSSSAPNVCYNVVTHIGDTASLEEFASRVARVAPASTGTGMGVLTMCSPGSSPTKPSHSHSAQASPTNTLRPWRPRARSADESGNKVRTPRESIEDWEIPADEILIGPRIGSGSFGTVYKGQWHGPVAVKTLNVKDPTPAQLQAFKN